MTWVELFVAISAYVGAAYMVATAVIGVCAIWWFALGRVRKCAYETYLLADMHAWMRARGLPGAEPEDPL